MFACFIHLKFSLKLCILIISNKDTKRFYIYFNIRKGICNCRSEDVTGHVTALAINSVNKFLSYDLIDVTKPGVRVAVENLADAVTHARFVGTDSSSDEVVLMKIIGTIQNSFMLSFVSQQSCL